MVLTNESIKNNAAWEALGYRLPKYDRDAMIEKTETGFKNIRYYHFSESYTDKEIVFDYKLSAGISRQSNAKYLMKLVGIE